MSFANPIVEAGVVGLAELYRTRAVTPVEATAAYLSRIDRLDGPLHAYLHLDAPRALAEAAGSAARWAQGSPRSPVDGAPVAIKANIAVTGLLWHGGIAAYRERIADADAAVVARLRAAGAVVLGVVNMHEGALGAATDNPAFGRTHNPHRHGFTPGGSSGGSGSAVAAGLCAAALGTDTMGSARLPSAYCGVWGHKPTRGLLPDGGVMPLSWTLDTVGVHARGAEDARAVLEACADAPLRPAAADRSWAVLEFEGQVEVDPEVAAAFDETVERARLVGFDLHPLRLSDIDFGALRRLGLLVSEAEGAAVHEAKLAEAPEGFSPTFAGMLDYGARQPALRLAKAYRGLAEAGLRLREALAPFCGLLSPAAPQPAFAFEAPVPAGQADFTALANFAGLAATVFPTGETAEGLPLSAQAMGWRDAATLEVSALLAAPVGVPASFRG